MTEREILFGAINKALKNGWKSEIISKKYKKGESITAVDYAVRNIKKHMDLLVGAFLHGPSSVFDHEFAQAFWKDSGICGCSSHARQVGACKHYGWKGHLQEMVVEENPIQYLKKFL